jgi:ABC-2 type transport system permease protein
MILSEQIRRGLDARELLWNLTLRELRTKYRKSFLGWFWSLLNPLATVAIYSVVFGKLFDATAPRGSESGITIYAVYLMCAILPWNFFGLVTNLGMNALLGNASLVKKVAFQRQTLVLAQVIFSLVQFAIEIALLVVVVSALGSPAWKHLYQLPILMMFFALFAGGIGFALSVMYVYFRDLGYLWQILLQVWFFATPIIYSPDLISGRVPTWVETLSELNPLYHFTAGFRTVLYEGTSVSAMWFLQLAISAVISTAIGLFIFKRLSRRLAEEL